MSNTKIIGQEKPAEFSSDPLTELLCKGARQLISGIVEGFNNKAELTVRKSYGFRRDELWEISLYHTLGNLPVPEFTHRFVWRDIF